MAYLYLLFREVFLVKELGEGLKNTRISNGVSLSEAAEDLDISTVQLQNIESGNVKAFKDVYVLKQYIRQYAKYLGLDCDKVVDEFNGFLFEHTSKISLDDIKKAQKSVEDSEKKIHSPYTKIQKEKIIIWPFVLGIVICLLAVSIVFFLLKYVVVDHEISEELSGMKVDTLCIKDYS